MNQVLFIAVLVLSCLLLTYLFLQLRVLVLPAYRRMARNEKVKEYGQNYKIGDRLDAWVKSVVPPLLYRKAELYLSRNGQSREWTVTKLIRSVVVASLSGLLVLFLLTLMYYSIPDANPGVLVMAILALPLYVAFPFLLFNSDRSDYLSKIIFQTPEFLDILHAELVRGSGSIDGAISEAASVMDGELRYVLLQASKFARNNPGNIEGLCTEIENHVNHPLYNRISLMLKQFHLTGRADSNIRALQDSCRNEVEKVHRQRTRLQTMMITIVALGVIANLALLIGVPMISKILNIEFLPGY